MTISDLSLKRESLGQKRVQNYLANREAFFVCFKDNLLHTNLWEKVKVALCFPHLSHSWEKLSVNLLFLDSKNIRTQCDNIESNIHNKNQLFSTKEVIKKSGSLGKKIKSAMYYVHYFWLMYEWCGMHVWATSGTV